MTLGNNHMEKSLLDISQTAAQARSHSRSFGQESEAAQDAWLTARQQVEDLAIKDVRDGKSREPETWDKVGLGDTNIHEIYTNAYREARHELDEKKQEALDAAENHLDRRLGISAHDAQKGERYSGEIAHVSQDYLVQISDKDNTAVIHDRQKIANGTDWAEVGKQAEVSYSPGGTGIAKETEREMEHHAREKGREHASTAEMSMERER